MRSARTLRWAVPAIIILFIWTLTTHGKPSDSGDEPHYLMVAESLTVDHDLDVENNYQHGDGIRFGHDYDPAEPGPHARRTRSGALWSVGDIGLPILLLPVYIPATRLAPLIPATFLARYRQSPGLFAYSLIAFALICLTAFGASLLFAGLRRIVSPGEAAAITLMLVLSPPVVSHAFLVFPEVPAFVVTCAVVWLLCQPTARLHAGIVAVIVGSLGLLPWMHHRFSFLSLGLIIAAIIHHRAWFVAQSRVSLLALALLFVLPQLGLHLYTWANWGTLGGAQALDGLPFSVSGIATGGVGLIADREFGLLAYGPIYLLVPACVALTWRRTWYLAIPLLLAIIPSAAFVVWRGGYAPAARYLVALTPLLTLPVAFALRRRPIRDSALALTAFQLIITLYAWQHPRALWPKGDGVNRVLSMLPIVGPIYSAWLPSMASPDVVVHVSAWLLSMIVGTFVLVRVARRAMPCSSGQLDRLGAEDTARAFRLHEDDDVNCL